MSEKSYWRRLRGDLDPRGLYVRVENEVDPGTPDVHWCLRGASGWIELKFIAAIPRYPNAKPLSTGHGMLDTQMNWIDDYLEHGGRVSILVGVAYRLTLAFPGDYARRLNGWRWEQLVERSHEIPAKTRINPSELP